ncbi:hypothetical protein [Photobacterium nomapromontoriensis]|uniref:hypothetical protein n=1 Tax=Photobacterium nomapromontoriensis TaxID=2910237 RepID=UPI003D139958
MTDYCLRVVNAHVHASRIIDGELEVIRFGGEASLPINSFWRQFKNKIEYEADEQLAFMIITDQDTFSLDPDIQIADSFMLSPTQLAWLLDDQAGRGQKILMFPEMAICSPGMTQPQPVVRKAVSTPSTDPKYMTEFNDEGQVDSLQTFFRKKTKAYSQGN